MTLDPHKGLFLPYGTGALGRDGSALRCARGARRATCRRRSTRSSTTRPSTAPSCRGASRAAGLADDQDLRRRPVASRDRRERIGRRCRRPAGAARDRPVAPPQLSLFAFRLEPACCACRADDATRRLLERVNARGLRDAYRLHRGRPIPRPGLRPELPHGPTAMSRPPWIRSSKKRHVSFPRTRDDVSTSRAIHMNVWSGDPTDQRSRTHVKFAPRPTHSKPRQRPRANGGRPRAIRAATTFSRADPASAPLASDLGGRHRVRAQPIGEDALGDVADGVEEKLHGGDVTDTPFHIVEPQLIFNRRDYLSTFLPNTD